MSFGTVVGITSQFTNIDTFLNNKTRAILSPKTSPGISGFVFDIPQTETITLSSDITDNFTEDNSFINDHRIIKPTKISLTGLVGELVIKSGFQDLILETLQSSLTTIDAYAGQYTNGMTQTIQEIFSTGVNAVSRATQLANRAKNIILGFDGEGQYNNLQQRAFNNLRSLFQSNTILTVQTPWEYYDNMLIETVEFTQNEETEFETEISVTLKEIRFAQVGVISYKDNLEASRNELQSKETVDTGKIQGSRNSFLFDASTALSGGF